MIPSDNFWRMRRFFVIVSKLLENSLEIITMELICVKVPEINFIVDVFLQKLWRQRQLFYLLCFKAFGKHHWKNYYVVLFSKGWRKYSIILAEMNFFVQTFSFETSWRQAQLFYLFCFKAFGEVLRDDYSRALFKKDASSNICNYSRNEPHHEYFPENVRKTNTSYFICFV